jgi:hypothetical protein
MKRTTIAGEPKDAEAEKRLRRGGLKNMVKALFILGAVENGWTVKKSNKVKNGVEFLRNEGSIEAASNSARRCISEPLRIIS